jgi:acetyl-CoA synthetase
LDEYRAKYKKSVDEPEGFWKEIAAQFYFKSHQPENKPFFEYNFNVTKGPIYTRFMEGAKTNICYNALDFNIEKRNLKDKIAFYWYALNHIKTYYYIDVGVGRVAASIEFES